MAWKYPALLFRDQILLLLRTTWSHIPSKFSILRWTPVLANWQDVWTAWCQIFQQFSEHLYQGHAVDFNDKVLQTLRKKNFVNCVCENEEDNPDMAENSRTNYGGGLMGKRGTSDVDWRWIHGILLLGRESFENASWNVLFLLGFGIVGPFCF